MDEEKIRKIMKGTCFGSLAFCCGFDKACENRDDVMEMLGLSKEEFIELKGEFDKKLIELVGRKNEKGEEE